MLVVETVAKIRRAYFVQGKAIKQICRELKLSRKTVRKVVRSEETAFAYERSVQPQPKLGPWTDELDRLLAANAARSGRERVTLMRIFEELRELGYEGGYDAVRRYGASWRRRESTGTGAAFVPLSFEPGEAYQFDWSQEIVLIGGTTVMIKVAHMRLCHSRMPFVRAYLRETQEKSVRCARQGVCVLQGRLHEGHLRQYEDRGGRDLRRQGRNFAAVARSAPTIAALRRCAAIIWWSRWPVRPRPAGRRVRSRTKSARCGRTSSRRVSE